MYEIAKSANTSTVTCSPQVEQPQLSVKCNNILALAREVDKAADHIKGNLFGPTPSEAEKSREPYSVDETLNIIKDTLESAYKTLADIRGRI